MTPAVDKERILVVDDAPDTLVLCHAYCCTFGWVARASSWVARARTAPGRRSSCDGATWRSLPVLVVGSFVGVVAQATRRADERGRPRVRGAAFEDAMVA